VPADNHTVTAVTRRLPITRHQRPPAPRTPYEEPMILVVPPLGVADLP
jgi:hypothetical protein